MKIVYAIELRASVTCLGKPIVTGSDPADCPSTNSAIDLGRAMSATSVSPIDLGQNSDTWSRSWYPGGREPRESRNCDSLIECWSESKGPPVRARGRAVSPPQRQRPGGRQVLIEQALQRGFRRNLDGDRGLILGDQRRTKARAMLA